MCMDRGPYHDPNCVAWEQSREILKGGGPTGGEGYLRRLKELRGSLEVTHSHNSENCDLGTKYHAGNGAH